MNDIPVELLSYILGLVDLRARLRLGRTCSAWEALVNASVKHLVITSSVPRALHKANQDALLAKPTLSGYNLRCVLQKFSNLQSLNLHCVLDSTTISVGLTGCSPTLKHLKVNASYRPSSAIFKSITNLQGSLKYLFLRVNPDMRYGSFKLVENEDARSSEYKLFELIARHGQTLEYLLFPKHDSFYQFFREPQLQRLVELAPNLKRFSHISTHYGLFKKSEAIDSDLGIPEGSFESLNWNVKYFYSGALSGDDWDMLADPRLKTLEKFMTWQHLNSDDIEFWRVYKNNPNIRTMYMADYVASFIPCAPYLKNVTRLHMPYIDEDEATIDAFRAIGKHMTSLVYFTCNNPIGELELKAFTEEMPENYPLEIFEATLSDSPSPVATLLIPKCPRLKYFNRSHGWDDDALRIFAQSGRLFKQACICGTSFTVDGLTQFFSSVGSEMLWVDISLEDTVTTDLVLSDEFIHNFVEWCPNLTYLVMRYVVGVSKEGWEPLRRLRSLQDVGIGSNTCSYTLLKEICVLPIFSAPLQTPAEREAERKAKEEAEYMRVHGKRLAKEWGVQKFQEVREELFQKSNGDSVEFLEEVKKFIGSTKDFPYRQNLKYSALKSAWRSAKAYADSQRK